MACGLARFHLVVCGGRGYAAAVVPPSLVRPLRGSQSPFPFALRLISIDPFFGLVGPYASNLCTDFGAAPTPRPDNPKCA